MSMDVGGAKGGVKSDINVTPLVDVMLVLLIIVMIIAPMLQKGVQVNLPLAANTTDKPDTADQTTVFVDAQGAFFVGTIKTAEAEVPARLKALIENKTDKTVYLKGDTDARYGAIMKMMDALRKAQIDNVGLITERKQDEKKGGGH
jgi:biopolymer transport protein ExbD